MVKTIVSIIISASLLLFISLFEHFCVNAVFYGFPRTADGAVRKNGKRRSHVLRRR